MIFQSLDFLVFLVIVFAVHWSVPANLRKVFLLLASYFFYGYVHPWFLLLLWFVTIAVYACGRGMESAPAYRRVFLGLGVGACLTMLGAFKYYNFFVGNVESALEGLRVHVPLPTLQMILPVGISFFAFQGMSYVIDVYRGDIPARKKFVDVALFKAFFPQLVAGPIERSTHFLPQLDRRRELSPSRLQEALFLILWGFFKKLVIADHVSVIANKVFALEQPAFPVLWAGVFAFCVQIYADFSGYTDIARGTAKLFGFDLMQNFNHPYLARSPVDFWRRWHISLSSWFRDYVYIPLGGNRKGRVSAAINVMLTFLLSGLWHGASWNYVVWGGYWGIVIVLYNNARGFFPSWLEWSGWTPVKVLLMFFVTNVGWLIFRETDLHYLLRYLALKPGAASPLEWQAASYLACLVALYSIPLVVHMAFTQPIQTLRYRSLWMTSATAAVLFAGVLLLRTATSSDFIYFQF